MDTKDIYPIKIAYIIGKMWAGGVETVVFNYYRSIDHSLFQVDFYYDEDSTVEPPQDLIDMGARFIKIPPYQHLFKYIISLGKHFRTENYDIVHSHINTLSVFPIFVAWKEHIPIRIAHNHSVPGGHEIKRNIAKHLLRLFSKAFSTEYFACSEKAGRWMFGNKTFNDGKVFIMKNAIDFSLFVYSNAEVCELKDRLNCKDSFVVGHVGRFTYAKNHEFLLDIFKELSSLKPNSKLLLIGDGELHDQIVAKIEHLKLNNNVILVGKVNDPYKYYSVMNVLILPSIFEGLSMTTVEAQAAKKNIVISSAVPHEAVFSDGCHYINNLSNAQEWAYKALDIANNEVTFDSRMQEYSIDTAARMLEKKYINTIEKEKNDKHNNTYL